MNRVLVIEDDAAVRGNILDLLEAEGFEGLAAENGESGVELALQKLPDLIICDVSMPGIDGYDVFELLSSRPSTAVIPFIFLSARAERADVRRGMALGADDYLTKPFTRRELLDSIQTRLRRRRSSLPADGAPPTAANVAPPRTDGLVMADSRMLALDADLTRAARGSISVLILGETGVGKEVVAEQLHLRSGRVGRFVPINCAALSENLLESELFGYEKGAFTGADKTREGLFEAANGGTLFLDEVGELPLATQVKLLRVLEERKVLRVGGRSARAVDVRFVAATHRDIEQAAEQGAFRQDLYYRLNGITLEVPPLRERPADIAPLAAMFLAKSTQLLGRDRPPQLSEAALQALLDYAWPGNIRELRNVVERALLLCDSPSVLPEHLPAKLLREPQAQASVAQDPRAELMRQMELVERQRIIDALSKCAGNQTLAAQSLGISRRTLVTRLAQFELPRPRKPRAKP
ncbi:MAG TPA: sigma-54 dependent transcriptional regulator [Polyangiales bacterium]|nr:sigma-54 dependent transcriptional regulator [Polyangiales bacterium]